MGKRYFGIKMPATRCPLVGLAVAGTLFLAVGASIAMPGSVPQIGALVWNWPPISRDVEYASSINLVNNCEEEREIHIQVSTYEAMLVKLGGQRGAGNQDFWSFPVPANSQRSVPFAFTFRSPHLAEEPGVAEQQGDPPLELTGGHRLGTILIEHEASQRCLPKEQEYDWTTSGLR